MRTFFAMLLPLLAACSAAASRAAVPASSSVADACDWQTQVLPADRAAVEVSVDAAIARIPSAAGMPGYLGGDLQEASLTGIVLAHALLQRARTPLPVGDVSGPWRVRSIQAGRETVFDYPFFRSEIDAADCGFAFRKTTGSQRRSGRLLTIAGNPRALAFLGTATVNDNRSGAYGPRNPPLGEANGSHGDTPVNSVGRLLRIGEDELLMILDADARDFELYHLKR